MILDFSVMYMDETVTDVHIDTKTRENLISCHIYGPKQPFNCGRCDVDFIYDFLRWRGFENRWFDLHRTLHTECITSDDDDFDLTKTEHHGANPMDFWWVKFPGEDLTWDEINQRK